METALRCSIPCSSACGLSDDEPRCRDRLGADRHQDGRAAGTKLVIAEQNATQSLPWNLANAGKDAPYGV